MCKLIGLMKTSIKLEISTEEIDKLEEGFAAWARLGTCTLLIHGCLHLSFKFDLKEELKDLNLARCGDEVLENESIFENYPNYILRTPHHSNYVPDGDTRGQIGAYLVQVLGGQHNELALHLPRVMPLWGKMWIHGGNLIQSMFALRRVKSSSRNNSFVRYEVTYTMDNKPMMTTSYGRLDKILVCELGHQQCYKFLCNKVLILALIVPCKTNGQDASISIVAYKELMAPVVTDIWNIKAVVGQLLDKLAFGAVDGEFPELGNWSDNTSDTD
ncbi:hypothetical protein BDR05DRAFT_978044 [Suillus weaverae]|nr:hypothetical protein BDR05DRAFT_978044 [Suillus weaverae]